MDKELILEAVKAVIEFNEKTESTKNSSGISMQDYGVWVHITEGESFDYIFSKHNATNEDIKNFINKLKELGEK